MHKFNAHRSGFTLIELIVTIGIMIVLGGIALVDLSGRRATGDLTSTSAEAVAALRQAESDAAAQKNGLAWGVYFSNAASGSYFSLYEGSSYASSTVVSKTNFPNDVVFATSSIASGGGLDINFAQVTGTPSASATMELDLVIGTARIVAASTTVTVNAVGGISGQ